MSIYLLDEMPIIEPVTIDEVKNHLRINKDFKDDDALIEMLITMARQDAEAKTGGRVFPCSEWEWVPDEPLIAGETYEVPISPALQIKSVRIEGEEEDIPSSSYKFVKSSLAPYGKPIYAKFTPYTDMENVTITVIAGWPNKECSEKVKHTTHPVLEVGKVVFSSNSMTLQFNRPVDGEVTPSSFRVSVNDSFRDIYDVDVVDGRVVLKLTEALSEGDTVTLSYMSGFLKDSDDNYVLPILQETFPNISLASELTPFDEPETIDVLQSTVPGVVKTWMLVRIATLYQQRSEIAIQAGKTSNAFFPRPFINGLLDSYTIEKA